MDHAAAERLDLLERLGQIIYGEVGQGEGVARPATPRMDPDRRRRRVRLPALSLVPGLERGPEQSGPEAPSPLGVIRGKLDQRQSRAGHRQDNSRAEAALSMLAAVLGTGDGCARRARERDHKPVGARLGAP